jgi:hypothetical protein
VSPKRDDFRNLDVILTNVERLRCDMYAAEEYRKRLRNISPGPAPGEVRSERVRKQDTKSRSG